MSAWSNYVNRIKDGQTQAEAAASAGIDQATMSRWVNGGKPGEAARVAEFARAHPESTTVLEAFVAAGFLTEEEAREG
jgi:transcriptional regulator with XRE-family HTH domain